MKPRFTKPAPSDSTGKVLFSFYKSGSDVDSDSSSWNSNSDDDIFSLSSSSDSDCSHSSESSHSSDSDWSSSTSSESFSDELSRALDDLAARERNAIIKSSAERMFLEAEKNFEQKDYANAVTAYEKAISLLKMIPEAERDFEYYQKLDTYAYNLADLYFLLKDDGMAVARFLTAYNALELIEKKSSPHFKQENQHWLAEYCYRIAGSLNRLADEARDDYLNLAMALLDRMKFLFGPRDEDKKLLARCYMMQDNYPKALQVLDSFAIKSDDYHRLTAECYDGLAIELDPIDEPVSEKTIASANTSLMAIMERSQVEHKTKHDIARIRKYADNLQTTLSDVERFIATNKRKFDEMDLSSSQESVSSSPFSTFKRPRLAGHREQPAYSPSPERKLAS